MDDDVDDQQYLIEALTENDCSALCVTANNGQEAMLFLKSSASELPSAIFLDLNMPRMGGKQCLSELKSIPTLRNIPVIIYSTSSDEQEISEVMQLGASYFLTKKSNFRELKQELSSITKTIF